MARTYIRVRIENESNATLQLRTASSEHGWTGPNNTWVPRTFPQIAPGAAAHWQAESGPALSATGVDATVEYDVCDAQGSVLGLLVIHAYRRYPTNAYGTRYGVAAPDGYYGSYSDVQGRGLSDDNHSMLTIRFRNTRRVAVPGFKPTVNGFEFSNRWSADLPVITVGWLWNQLVHAAGGALSDWLGLSSMMDEDWLPITTAASGLCGGMAFATMDYFYAGQRPPAPAIDSQGRPVAPSSANDPLFRFIRERLIDSFDVTGRGYQWLTLTSPLYPNGDDGIMQTTDIASGRSYVTYREEWPSIRAQLDQGKLATIGLVQSDELDVGANHQVLAYAYEQSGRRVKLWVYDPNLPGMKKAGDPTLDPDDLHLVFDISSTTGGVHVTRVNYGKQDTRRIFALLHMDHYVPHTPPAGRALPVPEVPVHKSVKLVEANRKSTTGDGVVTSSRKNACGDTLQYGDWKTRTEATFVAQITGYDDPKVMWSMNGGKVPTGTTVMYTNIDGKTCGIEASILNGGRALRLISQPGDTYEVPVRMEMRDAHGTLVTESLPFGVEGDYSGLRVEDFAKDGRCYAQNIPVPLDPWTFRPGALQIHVRDLREWQKSMIEALKINNGIDAVTRAKLMDYVNQQAERPNPLILRTRAQVEGSVVVKPKIPGPIIQRPRRPGDI